MLELIRRSWHTAKSAFRSPTRAYWEDRYSSGGDSGAGSEGTVAEFKAEVVNDFVRSNDVQTVIEFGCGDGRQLELADYPSYLGLDIARTAIERCQTRFADDPDKSFLWYSPEYFDDSAGFLQADLTLSLEVLFHLLEESVYRRYLEHLFGASRRHVVIFSSNVDDDQTDISSPYHIEHRKFSEDVERLFPNWELQDTLRCPHSRKSFSDFYFYSRQSP